MAYSQTSFASILDGFNIIAGIPFNATTGVREPTITDKAECAGLLNEVLRTIWSKDTWPYQLLPSLTTKATVTPSSGVVAWADIENAVKWSVWKTDPETSWTGGTTAAHPIYARESSTGLILENGYGTTSVVIFYQSLMPVFSHVAWVTSTAYAVGDVVLQGSNCYVCAMAHTSGTFASDLAASKWTAQTIPTELRQAVLRLIAEARSGDVQGKVAKTQMEAVRGADMLDLVFARASAENSPWFIHNGGFTR